jgi:hypothetical protein
MKPELPKFLAAIEWIPFASGGRRNPPRLAVGEHYMAPASVGSWDGNNAGSASWTLVVYNVTRLGEYKCQATVEYLVPEAPHETLQLGTKFEMYEGAKCVAKGQITEVL